MGSISADIPSSVLYAQILIYGICLIVWICKRGKSHTAKKILLAIFLVQVSAFIAYAVLLYRSLISAEIGKYLFSWNNEFYLHRLAIYVTTVVAGNIAAALVFLGTWFIFIQRGQERLLDRTDAVILTASAVAVGWPGILLLLGGVFITSLIGLLILIALRKKTIHDGLVITPYILPTAVVILVVQNYLLAITHLDKIRF